MITVFGLDPRSVVIAYMIAKVKGTKAVLNDPAKKYFFDAVEDARVADYDGTYAQYRERFGVIDFLEDRKLYDVICSDIFWALRFDSLDKATLVLQAIEQIALSGSKEYLSEGTAEAREMRFRVKRVLSEFNRALRYVKFTRYDEQKLSLASASFDNDICDMVMRGEATRCQEGSVVAIYDSGHVRILINGIPHLAKRQKVPLAPERKDFKRFWGGLPESGGSALVKDDVHFLKEIPSMIIPKMTESADKMTASESSTLDDFTG
jgi:hypothetical protein